MNLGEWILEILLGVFIIIVITIIMLINFSS